MPLDRRKEMVWPRTACAVWVLILLVLSIRTLASPRANSVYPIFAAAARHWLAGADLYYTDEAPYRYSPLVTVLFVPFSALPDTVGGLLWRWLNAGVYLAALAAWGRLVLPRLLTKTQEAFLFLLVVPLSIGSLNNGQSNALVLGLLLAAMVGVRVGRWNMTSGCLALACLFKLYPVAIGLLLALIYPRRLAGRFALALGIGLAAPFLFQQPDYVISQYAGWIRQLRADDRQILPLDLWYRDLRLLCQVCHVPLSSQAYLAIQLLSAATLAGFCLACRRAGWEERRLLTALFALGCVWMTLLGPATESCTYILLAPTLAWSLLEAWRRKNARWPRDVLVAGYALWVVVQAAVWFPGGSRKVHTLGLQPLAALVFLMCLPPLFKYCDSADENENQQHDNEWTPSRAA
jgi:hypothetical protein